MCVVFCAISSNINEVLSTIPSANRFLLQDFNVHHKDWVTYSGEINRPGEVCYNFSILNDLTQMVDFPTLIPALLDLSIPSGASICSTVAFSLLGNFNYAVASVFIHFPSNSKCKIALLMTILVLIGMVFVII